VNFTEDYDYNKLLERAINLVYLGTVIVVGYYLFRTVQSTSGLSGKGNMFGTGKKFK
jgi:hypothetical protein